MAASKEAVDFNEIIQAGRQQDMQRKAAEDLAKEIFGKARKVASPAPNGRARPSPVHGLSGRITKPGQRSLSSSSVPRSKPQFHTSQSNGHGHGIVNRKSGEPQFEPRSQPNGKTSHVREFNIKGAAGPYVVVASNFAPGTTSADIKSAVESVTGEMLSCTVVTSYPTVIAEMVFVEKAFADTAVQTFNNQMADGRLLHVYMKNGPPTPAHSLPQSSPASHPRSVVPAVRQNDGRELLPDKLKEEAHGFGQERRAQPEYQDGRYGFESKDEPLDVEMDAEPAPVPVSAPVPVAAPKPDQSRPSIREPQQDSRYAGNDRDRYGYRQGFSRDGRDMGHGFRGRDTRYGGEANYRNDPGHRSQQPNRLYSDDMYGRPRGRGYH